MAGPWEVSHPVARRRRPVREHDKAGLALRERGERRAQHHGCRAAPPIHPCSVLHRHDRLRARFGRLGRSARTIVAVANRSRRVTRSAASQRTAGARHMQQHLSARLRPPGRPRPACPSSFAIAASPSRVFAARWSSAAARERVHPRPRGCIRSCRRADEPDETVGRALERSRLAASRDGSPRSQPSVTSTATAPASTRRDQRRFELAQRVADACAARPIVHRRRRATSATSGRR